MALAAKQTAEATYRAQQNSMAAQQARELRQALTSYNPYLQDPTCGVSHAPCSGISGVAWGGAIAQGTMSAFGSGIPQRRPGPYGYTLASDGTKVPVGQTLRNVKFGQYAGVADKFATPLTILGAGASAYGGYLSAQDNGESTGDAIATGASEGVGDTVIGVATVANTAAIGFMVAGPAGAAAGALVGIGISIFADNSFNDAISGWF
ncbi:hypothetical protein ABIA32_004530 [Streptacidiphilus sp. MAP12-20]|uniref:hypothetical protein n=1 Tax=Streptacidiphilus sp. MAP12-20 TaxID=3156299 RepID=UPI0035137333